MPVRELAPLGVHGGDRAPLDDGDHAAGIYSLSDIPPERLDIAAADRLDRDAFVARFGGVFEGSPWIAAAAWDTDRPFGSVEALHAAMLRAVARGQEEQRLALIRAHPDLAGRAAIAGELTPESTREQAAAGLDVLTPAQHEQITVLTAAYRERFGFPFVVCAREHTPDSIIAAVHARLDAGAADEQRTALAEIGKIARLRLDELVA